MNKKTFTKVLAVIVALSMLTSGGVLFAHAACEHSSYTWTTVTEPDCKNETDGLEQKICDDCGAVLDENKLEWELSHDFSLHTIIKYPTCTEKGEAKDKCSHCGKLTSFTILFPNLHEGIRNEAQGNGSGYYVYSSHVSWFTDEPATCTKPGLRHGVCNECGETVASEPIEPLGHSSQWYDDYLDSTRSLEDYIGCSNVSSKLPTCTEPGYVSFLCDTCGEPMKTFTLKVNGHDGHYNESMDHYHTWWRLYEEGTYQNPPDVMIHTDEEDVDYIPETCTEQGKVVFKCHECQEVLETVLVPAKGHHNAALESWDYCFATDPDFGTTEDLKQYIEWNNVDYIPETCTEPGKVIFKCADCQTVMRTMTIAPTGHFSEALEDYKSTGNDPASYVGQPNVAYKAPTCTETGSVTFKCDECKEELLTVELDPLGHDQGTWTIDMEATADHSGWMSLRCNRCGELIEKKEFQLHDHKFGEWYPNNDGTHSHICSACSFFDTAPCKYETTVTPATCLEGGYTTYVCKDCGYTYVSDYTDPLGHDWDAWTDDGNGETHTHVCKNCGAKETEDHCFGEWVYNHDAKFFKNGTKTCICEVCGCTVTEEAKHTAWIWHLFYPIELFLGSTTHKAIFVASLYWLFPWLNLYPEI